MAISSLTRELARHATLDPETQATLRANPLIGAIRTRTVAMQSRAPDFSDQVIAVAMNQPATRGDVVPTGDRVAAARSYLREAIADDAETYRQAASMERGPATAMAVGGVGMIVTASVVLSGPVAWFVALTGGLITGIAVTVRARADAFLRAADVETAALQRALAKIEQQ